MATLTARLERVQSGHITMRYDPGAPALERLGAIADGIDIELTKPRNLPSPTISPVMITHQTRSVGRDDMER